MSFSAVQGPFPQRFGPPPPPQVIPFAQDPQVSRPPHPSATVPQSAPAVAHVFRLQGAATHLWASPHSKPSGQLPHESVPPQPSSSVPHDHPSAAHVVASHATHSAPASSHFWPASQQTSFAH